MGTPTNPISMLDSSSVIEWCTKCVPHAANVTNAVDNAAHAFASDANTNLGFQITAVLAVFLGFLLCFFGWSLFHITLCLTGALIGLGRLRLLLRRHVLPCRCLHHRCFMRS